MSLTETRHPSWFYVVLSGCAILLAASVAYHEIGPREQWQLRSNAREGIALNPDTGVLCRQDNGEPTTSSCVTPRQGAGADQEPVARLETHSERMARLKERIAMAMLDSGETDSLTRREPAVRPARRVGIAVVAFFALLLAAAIAYRFLWHRRDGKGGQPDRRREASEGPAQSKRALPERKALSPLGGFRERYESVRRREVGGHDSPSVHSKPLAGTDSPLSGEAPSSRTNASPLPLSGQTARQEESRGITGWLGYFAFNVGLTICVILYTTFGAAEAWGNAAATRGVEVPLDWSTFVVYASILWAVAAAFGLSLMWVRHSVTRDFWVIVLAFGSLFSVAMALSWHSPPHIFGVFDTPANPFIRNAVVTLIWLAYWHRSKRVTATYEPPIQKDPRLFGPRQYSIISLLLPPLLTGVAAVIALLAGWMWGIHR
jgi:hypothetical protein